MDEKKEYIERGALIDFLKQEIEQCENDFAESCGDDRYEQAVDVRMTAFLEVLRRVENKTAADVVSKGVYEQVQWERDMAMQQLEEHGIPFCGKADVVEVRHGEWEKVYNHRECNRCGYKAPYKKIKAGYHLQDLSKFCPNCGARMDGERKEQT